VVHTPSLEEETQKAVRVIVGRFIPRLPRNQHNPNFKELAEFGQSNGVEPGSTITASVSSEFLA
jgi:hypothetical protein